MALEQQSTYVYVYIRVHVRVCVCVCEPVTCVADPDKPCLQVYYIDFLCLIFSPLVFHTSINSPFSTASNLVGYLIQVQTFNYFFTWENWKRAGTNFALMFLPGPSMEDLS